MAVEDPVEPAAAVVHAREPEVAATLDGKAAAEPAADGAEPATKAPRRRRKAVSPVTTL